MSKENLINKEKIIEMMKDNNIDIDYDIDMNNKSFEELGLDSVDLMMLSFSIKEEYKVDFMINRSNTMEHMIEVVNREINSKEV